MSSLQRRRRLSVAVAITALFAGLARGAAAAGANDDLPAGVMRGPLLHEHSFQYPLVSDWWEEGVPHFMIGGSALANEKFVRLTTNSLDEHGFAFNTAPMDHENWELRMKFSIRPPPPAADMGGSSGHYEGGDGMALWYLPQPIGDDHQHVIKYTKSITPEVMDEILESNNPWRTADFLLNTDDEEEDAYDGLDEDDLTEAEKKERDTFRERRAEKQRKREKLFRRLFKRGTSIDDSTTEPRIMGVKHSDFTSGFALVFDSVGDETQHQKEHKEKGDAVAHHHHKASITMLLHLPNHTSSSGAAVKNNFNPSEDNFRRSAKVLQCDYDFRQQPTPRYDINARNMDAETRAATAPEEPLELVLRYYMKKLSVIIRRENPNKRQVTVIPAREGENEDTVDVVRTYTETMCGELFPITLPLNYHFGISASTGHRSRLEKRGLKVESTFHREKEQAFTHVDVHDVLKLEFRELGTDAKAMGYSKTIPLEHFDFEADRRERQHFSRQIPVEPDADTP